MQRLPNVHPSDTTKWPNELGTFDVGAADTGSKILIYNLTALNIDLDFLNGSTDVIHAWEANYWVLDGDTKQIEWLIDPDSLNVSSPPIASVFLTLWGSDEKIPGTYPVSLMYQASIGNQGGLPTSNTSVINDGNTLQQVVEATLQGHLSSDVIINNDGSYTLKGAGLIAAVGVLTHILGTLTVDQLATFTANIVANAGLTVANAPAFTAKQIKDGSGNVLADWSGAGLSMMGNPASLKYFGYGRDQTHEDFHMGAVSLTGISFTGNGTFNHNCTEAGSGVVPDEPWHNPYSGAPPGSQTMGFQSFTTTTIFITTGAGLAGKVHMWVHA